MNAAARNIVREQRKRMRRTTAARACVGDAACGDASGEVRGNCHAPPRGRARAALHLANVARESHRRRARNVVVNNHRQRKRRVVVAYGDALCRQCAVCINGESRGVRAAQRECVITSAAAACRDASVIGNFVCEQTRLRRMRKARAHRRICKQRHNRRRRFCLMMVVVGEHRRHQRTRHQCAHRQHFAADNNGIAVRGTRRQLVSGGNITAADCY